MRIDWAWVARLAEAKSLERLEEEANQLEGLAEKAEKEVKIRKRIADARKRIKDTKPASPFSNLSKGALLLVGLVLLLIFFLVYVKSCT